MSASRALPSSVSLAFLVLVLPGSSAALRAELFEPHSLANRYPVGDPTSENPIDWSEGPKSLAAGDLDGDGRDDVVVGNLDGSISVVLATGDRGMRDQILHPAGHLLEGASIRAVEVADFDADGVLDVVAADIARQGIVFLAGAGDGTLVPLERVELGPARALASADLDGDGARDLVVACSPADCDLIDVCFDPVIREKNPFFCDPLVPQLLPPSLLVLPGNGDGTFGQPRFLLQDSGGCLYDVACADVDADGARDVVALDYTRRELLFFGGRGDGSFAAPVELEVPGQGPRAFSLAHLDERLVDGALPPGASLDVVVAGRDSGTLDVFLGRGAFGFAPPLSVLAGDAPRDVEAADLDGDGFADLVVTNRNTGTISVFQGLGGGRFPEPPLELPTGTSPRNIALGDFDGDGAVDAAVNNRYSEDVSVFYGQDGAAAFLLARGYYPSGIGPAGVVTGDFDEDGRPDVASVSLRSHELRVRLNTGRGTLDEETVYALGSSPLTVARGDLDGDGHLDLVAAGLSARPVTESGAEDRAGGDSLSVLLGHGDGSFAGPVTVVERTPAGHCALRLGDLSGDGVLDIAAGGMRGELVVYRGRGDGTFDAGVLLPSERTGRPLNLTLGDFDNDGRLDIATSQAWLLLNDGRFFSGSWSGDKRNIAEGVQQNRRRIDKTWFVDSADLDRDGNLDLVLALTFVRPDPIAVFFGKGDGTFWQPDIYDGPDMGVVASIAEDMDGDGVLDIVVGNRCAATVIIFKGIGGRRFERLETVPAYSVEGLAVADLDSDGRPDLVGAGLGLWVLLNGGRHELVEPTRGEQPGLVPADGVLINEVMAFNRGFYVNVAGETPDWIEFYNSSPRAQDLSGWVLRQETRDGEEREWAFPEGTQIGPAQHLVVFCGGENAAVGPMGGLVCSAFGLYRGGETLVLLDASGTEVDRVAYPPMPPDVSYGRHRDGVPLFGHHPLPTIGGHNIRPSNIRPLVRAENPFIADGTEVGVAASALDDVGIAYIAAGYRLESDAAGDFTEVPLADDGRRGDVLAGDGVFSAVLPDVPPGAGVLYYLRAIDLEGQEATVPGNVSRPERLLRLRAPAPGEGLRLSEMVPDNETGLRDESGQPEDWIEIENCGAQPASLDGTALTKDFFDGDRTWPLPAGLTLPPGERLVVFCDRDTGQGPLHASFRLDRDGDQVLLVRPGDPAAVLDSLGFDRVAEDTAFGRPECGAAPALLGQPTPGAPNVPGVPFRRGDVNADGRLNVSDPIGVLGHLFLGGAEPPCADAADADDSGKVDLTDAVNLLGHLFLGRAEPRGPFASCGVDPSADVLGCDAFRPCGLEP